MELPQVRHPQDASILLTTDGLEGSAAAHMLFGPHRRLQLDPNSHPLLNENASGDQRLSAITQHHTTTAHHHSDIQMQIMHAIHHHFPGLRSVPADAAAALMSRFTSDHRNRGTPVHVTVTPGANGMDISIEMQDGEGQPGIETATRFGNALENELLTVIKENRIVSTLQRWHQEQRIYTIGSLSEQSVSLRAHLKKCLTMHGITADKKHDGKSEEQAKQSSIHVAESLDGEAKSESGAVADTQSTPDHETTEPLANMDVEVPSASTVSRNGADAQASLSDGLSGQNSVPSVAPSAPGPPIVDEPPTTQPSQSASEPPRVFITVNGEPRDITDYGIDPTFLEALPDDMRDEILRQHEMAAGSHSPIIPEQPSELNAEFLASLPDDIRAELLEQEAEERQRNDIQPEPAPSLNVNHRPSNDELLNSLNADLQEQLMSSTRQLIPHDTDARAATRHDDSSEEHRDSIQLLDRASILNVLRLTFFPSLSRQSHLYKVLLHLCQNTKSRTEILTYFITILLDGTGDLLLVDKSFSQMSIRSKCKLPLADLIFEFLIVHSLDASQVGASSISSGKSPASRCQQTQRAYNHIKSLPTPSTRQHTWTHRTTSLCSPHLPRSKFSPGG